MFKKFFQKLTESKNPESKRYRMQMARRICGHHIKYVTERKDDVEEVIGRSGGPAFRRSELLRLVHLAGIAASVAHLPPT